MQNVLSAWQDGSSPWGQKKTNFSNQFTNPQQNRFMDQSPLAQPIKQPGSYNPGSTGVYNQDVVSPQPVMGTPPQPYVGQAPQTGAPQQPQASPAPQTGAPPPQYHGQGQQSPYNAQNIAAYQSQINSAQQGVLALQQQMQNAMSNPDSYKAFAKKSQYLNALGNLQQLQLKLQQAQGGSGGGYGGGMPMGGVTGGFSGQFMPGMMGGMFGGGY